MVSQRKLRIYPYFDPVSGKGDTSMVAVKVPAVSMSKEKYVEYLASLGLELAVGHPIVTGKMYHIAVVPRASFLAAERNHPQVFVIVKNPLSLTHSKKWTSSGCVILAAKDDFDHLYISRQPSNFEGKWVFSKGRVEKGESLKETAVREAEEETGLKVQILPGRKSYVGKGIGGFSITHYFLAVRVGGHPHPTKEMAETKKVTWDEAAKLFKSTNNVRDQKILRMARQVVKLYK